MNDSNVLDDEFKRYLNIAKGLMRQMSLAEDKRVCAKYIRECISMSTHNATIKSNRNMFFRYLLKAMNRAVEDEKMFVNINDVTLENRDQQTVQWSADLKTYVAAKVIPGFGALIYMASTEYPNGPEGGWENFGFGRINEVYNGPSPFVEKETKATKAYNIIRDEQNVRAENARLQEEARLEQVRLEEAARLGTDAVINLDATPDNNAVPVANPTA